MEFIRRNTNFLFVLILPVYLYIAQQSIQNKHTHVCSDGIVITHSHPLGGEEEDSHDHEHSDTEINLYSSLYFELYEITPFKSISAYLKEKKKKYFISEQQLKSNLACSLPIPRAPPSA